MSSGRRSDPPTSLPADVGLRSELIALAIKIICRLQNVHSSAAAAAVVVVAAAATHPVILKT